MLSGDSPATESPRFWSWKKTLLVFLMPPVAVLAAVIGYDEKRIPWPDKFVESPAAQDPVRNGYLMLKSKWPGLDTKEQALWRAMKDGRIPWDDGIVTRLNPKKRDYAADLALALAAPDWQNGAPSDYLIIGPRYRSDFEPELNALEAAALLEGRAGRVQEGIDLIRQLRRLARRQIEGSGHDAALRAGYATQRRAVELTCLLASGGFLDGAGLTALEEIWDQDEFTARNLLRPLAGESMRLEASFDDPSVHEVVYGNGVRAFITSRLQTKRNITLNAIDRRLGLVREKAMSSGDEPGIYDMAAVSSRRPEPGLLSRLDLNFGGRYLWLPMVDPVEIILWHAGAHLNSRRLMRTFLSIKRWQLTHPGAWPARLEELVPECLPEIPLDPWTGQPVRWDATQKVLHSFTSRATTSTLTLPARNRGWLASDWAYIALRMELPPPPPPKTVTPPKRKPVLPRAP